MPNAAEIDLTLTEKSFREVVVNIFTKAGFSPKEVTIRRGQDAWEVDVSMEDAGLAIGEEGAHLAAWEQVLRAALQKFLPETSGYLRVSLDLNHYRAMHNEELREIARRAAREAVLKKKPVELAAMSAYERRIIHTELALRPDVMTESAGEAPSRKVVVKPLE